MASLAQYCIVTCCPTNDAFNDNLSHEHRVSIMPCLHCGIFVQRVHRWTPLSDHTHTWGQLTVDERRRLVWYNNAWFFCSCSVCDFIHELQFYRMKQHWSRASEIELLHGLRTMLYEVIIDATARSGTQGCDRVIVDRRQDYWNAAGLHMDDMCVEDQDVRNYNMDISEFDN